MPAHTRHCRHARRGTIAVAMIVVLILVFVMVISIVTSASRLGNLSASRIAATRAQYAADSAIAMAVREIKNNTDEDANGTVGAISSGAGKALGSTGTNILATVALSGNVFTITATGTSASATRKLQSTVTRVVIVPDFYLEDWDVGGAISSTTQNNFSSTPSFVGTVPQLQIASATNRPRWNGHQGYQFFSRWRGNLIVPTSATYSFWTTSDDGVKLWVNNSLIIDNDTQHSSSTDNGSIYLTAGTVPIELRYFENGGGSVCTLEWQGGSIASRRFLMGSDVTCSLTQFTSPFAINGAVTLGSSNTLVGFDSNSGVFNSGTNTTSTRTLVSTNSSSAGAVSVGASTTFNGNALAPPGSTASSVISGTITGTKTTMGSRIAIPEYFFQGTIPASSGSGIVPANTVNTFSTPSSRWSTITCQSNSTLNISGDVTIFVDGDLYFNINSKIVVPSGSRLTWVVGGNITVNGTGVEINMNNVNGNCRFFFTSLSGGGKSFSTTSTGAVISADIWAPWSAVSFADSTTFSGTIRADSLTTGSSCTLHGDVSAQIGSGGSSSITVNSWAPVAP